MKPTIQQQLKKLKFFGVRLRSRSKRVSVFATKRVRVGYKKRDIRLVRVRTGSRVNRWFGTPIVALLNTEWGWNAIVIESELSAQLNNYRAEAKNPKDALLKLERNVRKELRVKIRQLQRWSRTRAAYGTLRYDRVYTRRVRSRRR